MSPGSDEVRQLKDRLINEGGLTLDAAESWVGTGLGFDDIVGWVSLAELDVREMLRERREERLAEPPSGAFQTLQTDEGPIEVPLVEAIVTENLEAISEAYKTTRLTVLPVDAFLAAVEIALTPLEHLAVTDFMLGRMDNLYSPGAGFSLMTTVGVCEILSGHMELAEVQDRRWSTMNTADLAEELAAYAFLADWHRLAGESGLPDAPEVVVDRAVTALIANASRAFTKIGRKTKIDQATFVLNRIAKRAAEQGPTHQRACRL